MCQGWTSTARLNGMWWWWQMSNPLPSHNKIIHYWFHHLCALDIQFWHNSTYSPIHHKRVKTTQNIKNKQSGNSGCFKINIQTTYLRIPEGDLLRALPGDPAESPAGDPGALTSGDWGPSLPAGDWGLSSIGDCGPLLVGDCGSLPRGELGPSAGDWGALSAGECAPLPAGDCGGLLSRDGGLLLSLWFDCGLAERLRAGDEVL